MATGQKLLLVSFVFAFGIAAGHTVGYGAGHGDGVRALASSMNN